MNIVAQWIGYGVMALGAAVVIAGLAWLVTELLWRQAQRVNDFDNVVNALRWHARNEGLIRDHERYLWLAERLIGADFAWGDPPRPVLVFEWPAHVPVGGSCDKNIDAAIEREKFCDENCAIDNHCCGKENLA